MSDLLRNFVFTCRIVWKQALFAFMITRRRESALTYATLVPVVVGIMLSTKGESHFVLFGAFMAVSFTVSCSLLATKKQGGQRQCSL